MKTPTVFSGRPSATGLDVLVAKLGLVAAVLLLGLQLFASRPYLLVIPLSLGVGSGLYLATRNERSAGHDAITLPGWIAGYVPALVFLALALLVVLTRVVGARTVPIYVLIGAVGATIVGQILFVADDALAPGTVLLEILAAALVVRLSALFVTPGYVGVDIWIHATVFVDGIASGGSSAALAESKYVMAPIYHAFGAVGTLVFGKVRPGIYLTVGVVVPLATIFVYSTGKLLVPVRWALLATVLYAFGDQVIRWGIHLIPTSLGLVFFLAAVYLVARTFARGAEPWAVVLALLAALAVVFTHQVATAITLVFLGVAAAVAVGRWAFGGDGARPGRTALALVAVFGATLVTTVVSWSTTPFAGDDTFLGREIAVIARTIAEDAGFLNLAGGGGGGGATGGEAASSAFAWLLPYVELFGFALLLAAAVLGGLFLLWRAETPGLAFTVVLSGAALFVLVFGLSIFGIRALLPGRWMAFLYAPMSVLAAAGLFRLARSDARALVVVAFVVLAVGYPTTMVVAEKATLDSPAFDDRHTRFAYTGAEIQGVETIGVVSPPAESGTFRTDHPYNELFEGVGGYEDGDLLIGPNGPVDADTVVARDYQTEGPPGFGRTVEDGRVTGDGPVCPGHWNRVYANDDVRLCTETGGER